MHDSSADTTFHGRRYDLRVVQHPEHARIGRDLDPMAVLLLQIEGVDLGRTTGFLYATLVAKATLVSMYPQDKVRDGREHSDTLMGSVHAHGERLLDLNMAPQIMFVFAHLVCRFVGAYSPPTNLGINASFHHRYHLFIDPRYHYIFDPGSESNSVCLTSTRTVLLTQTFKFDA